ncbi:chaps-domain-containing protein [Basidiobolus meristosporus CBS 931.73]|uniref:Chaps-domain-containing protein n=1 Tax=Basidiobolus meristosporus CBS 931.73 TaxID=1314790 RepID=A0A1Y1YDS6_9FUNG|nr:chaps-domain-containing protein [Basidiobolus meristosporus CBS 931.73]|eukprot:ORX96147.1 chaps-domain-containing protein [Basidiobolus meristosporus CBS 931.73]
MSETLKDIPEIFENELKESLNVRTEELASYKELGPPDLCHVTKSTGKQGIKEIGSYHHIMGIDASSSASLAAYINSLTYSLDDTHGWFGKGAAWKINSGVYCCYNAFSRVDVRVEVNIPGGVSSYVVDHKGAKTEAKPEIWHEAYVSSILRSFLYSGDEAYHLLGLRKLDPIANLDAERRFLESAEQVFFKGWQLGSDPTIQVATNARNYLVDGLMKYFTESGRFDVAATFFEKIYTKDPEVTALLAQSYFGMDEEIKGVNALHHALKKKSMSYPLLHVQADFLLGKNKMDIALQLAKQSVNSAPSEFLTWAKLTEIYMELNDFDSALLTLNSCPMFTYTDRDIPRMPQPLKIHLPTKVEGNYGIVPEEEEEKELEVQSTLARLPAPSLKGTFARAYNILTLLVSKIGWDDLLRCRSAVFVMEEEYRLQRAHEHTSPSDDESTPNSDKDDDVPLDVKTKQIETQESSLQQEPERPEQSLTNAESMDNDETSEGASTTSPISEPPVNMEATAEDSEPKVSDAQESIAEKMKNANLNDSSMGTSDHQNMLPSSDKSSSKAPQSFEIDDPQENEAGAEQNTRKSSRANGKKVGFNIPAVEKDNEQSDKDATTPFSNKRLCERWLDNLFMVLYEDLRAYTSWRAEAFHVKSQQLIYSKTGSEWEALGDLALRLHHKKEAKEAYERCLHNKFSAKAWTRLMKIYADEDDLQQTLSAIAQLVVHNERWYNEMVYPSLVSEVLNRLIKSHGLSKVQNVLISINLPAPVYSLVNRHFNYAEVFKIEGSEW